MNRMQFSNFLRVRGEKVWIVLVEMGILVVEVLDFVDELVAELLFSSDWDGAGLLHRV